MALLFRQKTIGFFIIFHKSHVQQVEDLIRSGNIKQIAEIEKFLTSTGVYTQALNEEDHFAKEMLRVDSRGIEQSKGGPGD